MSQVVSHRGALINQGPLYVLLYTPVVPYSVIN